MAKAKQSKTKTLPQGWETEETADGLRATKHFTESELVAYGADEDELFAAVQQYEAQIAAGNLAPR